MGDGLVSQLKPRQVQAVSALLREPTLVRAAERVGVTERTLRRWLADRDFRAALDSVRRELFHETLTRMQGGAERALEALHGVLEDDKARPSDKVSAARVLLDHARRATEVLDVEERLAAVEGVLEARKETGR